MVVKLERRHFSLTERKVRRQHNIPVASLGEDLHQIVGEVTAGEIEPEDGVGESVALVDGDGVGDTISGCLDL